MNHNQQSITQPHIPPSVEAAGRALGISDLQPDGLDFRAWLTAVRQGDTSPPELRGFTLYQPWATIMARGYKRMETRDWRASTSTYPLLLALHAGARSDRQADNLARQMQLMGPAEPTPRKAIVAMAWAHCPISTQDPDILAFLAQQDRQPEKVFGDFSPGRFAWPMDIYPLTQPVPANGHFKLWKPSDSTRDQLRQMLAAGDLIPPAPTTHKG